MRNNSRIQRRKIRRIQKRKKLLKKFIRYITIFTFVMMLSYMSYGIYKENNIKHLDLNEDIDENIIYINNVDNTNSIVKEIIYEKVDREYLNCEVDCKLEIPIIKLSMYVLSKYSSKNLDVCASKYYGPEPNEIRELLHCRT